MTTEIKIKVSTLILILALILIIVALVVGYFIGSAGPTRIVTTTVIQRIIEGITETEVKPITMTEVKTITRTETLTITAPPITKTFTRFEEVEIISAYAEAWPISGYFEVTLTLMNTGPIDVIIEDVIINEYSFRTYAPGTITVTIDGEEINRILPSLKPGKPATMIIYITAKAGFKSGQTLDIMIRTCRYFYAKGVVLP